MRGFFLFFELRKLLPEIEEKYKVRKLYFRYARVLNMSFLKYKKNSVMLGFWIYLSRNTIKLRYARVLNIPFLKYKKSSISWNIKNFFRVSVSWNIGKAFFWENIRNFFGVSVSSNIRTNIRKAFFREHTKIS